MRRLVSVSPHHLSPDADGRGNRCDPRTPAAPDHGTPEACGGLALRVRAGGREHGLRARVGPQRGCADEHFAVDADLCREPRWLACADVLHGRRPRSGAAAERWLARVLRSHPACRVAAVALLDGGWAVSDRADLLLVAHVPAERDLLASCLHGWLTSGHALRDIDGVRLLSGVEVNGP